MSEVLYNQGLPEKTFSLEGLDTTASTESMFKISVNRPDYTF